MTAASNGTSKPEDDDPFGYLYEDGRAAGAVPPGSGGGYGYPGPASQPGVPRTSYNQVRTVGERQYGQQQQQHHQQQYAQQVPPQQQYNRPHAHYAAPETQPGGAPTRVSRSEGIGGGGRSGGPNTKALLTGAVAVVAVVVIGIGVALMGGGDKGEAKGNEPGSSGGGSSEADNVKPSEEPAEKPEEPLKLPAQDAATLQLSGFSTDTTITGAKSSSGAYVPMNAPGGTATWTVKVPKAGAYTLSIDYGVPGKDAKTSLSVNGKPHGGGLNMKNFANAEEGAWDKGWTNTYAFVNLDKGENSIVISCGEGDQCEANLDRLDLKSGHVK